MGPDAKAQAPAATTLEDVVRHRAGHLADYQDDALAARYRARVDKIAGIESERTPESTGLALAVAKGYHKLLAYKDEYEVARLYTDGEFARQLGDQFDGVRRLEFHMAPPLLSRIFRDKASGHPRKVSLPGWLVMPLLATLAPMRRLRGSALDVFGYTAERRREREMIADYERVLDEIATRLAPANHATALELAALALDIKGFGHVKAANHEKARLRQAVLLAKLRAPALARTVVRASA